MTASDVRIATWYVCVSKNSHFRNLTCHQGYVRAINPAVQAGERWSWKMTSPAMLAHAVKEHGWMFLPNQVLPPLLANTIVGAVLYAGYLQTLGTIHEPSAQPSKRIYPPPSFGTAATAGFVAGGVQSLIAAPVDALQVRFQSRELMEGKYRDMWQYGYLKTREIGLRGIFAGWSLSFVRDSIGYGLFFGTFEYIKSQCFYRFVSEYYGHYGKLSSSQQAMIDSQSSMLGNENPVIKPHYLMEPCFIGGAGVAASIAQQVVQHPIGRIQDIHYDRLEYIDSHDHSKAGVPKREALKLYASAYRKTWKQVLVLARRDTSGLRRWLYKDFFWSTLKQVPSTSIGLIVFEVVRRKYATDEDNVLIEKDGYDIMLP